MCGLGICWSDFCIFRGLNVCVWVEQVQGIGRDLPVNWSIGFVLVVGDWFYKFDWIGVGLVWFCVVDLVFCVVFGVVVRMLLVCLRCCALLGFFFVAMCFGFFVLLLFFCCTVCCVGFSNEIMFVCVVVLVVGCGLWCGSN